MRKVGNAMKETIRARILELGADVCGFDTVNCNNCRSSCPMRDGVRCMEE